jgi:hypothetical protein
MRKKIIAVGFTRFPADEKQEIIECITFSQHVSLIDADIVIMSPDIQASQYDYGSIGNHQGKSCLSDNGSGKLVEDIKFWKKEIERAIEAEKTIFFISQKPEIFYYATGKKEFSGTGKNQRTTRIVDVFHPYSIFPIELSKIHISSGTSISYKNSNPLLKNLWLENQKFFQYEVCYDVEIFKTLSFFEQTKGKDSLGGILKLKKSNFVVLPDINFLDESFTKYIQNRDDHMLEHWTDAARSFTHNFAKSLIEIDKALRNDTFSLSPTWIDQPQYIVDGVKQINSEIFQIDTEIKKLLENKKILENIKSEMLRPRSLLFETGAPLEEAVRNFLIVLGFKAENFTDAESEFDVVFQSSEGTFLGEVEGKDSKAVDVSKISQLMRNLTEYLSKEEVTDPAKGILFGNGYRLTEPKDREIGFTDKCIKVSLHSNIVLVHTHELFPIVNYLNENTDDSFKLLCRKALLQTASGIVKFPEIPKK